MPTLKLSPFHSPLSATSADAAEFGGTGSLPLMNSARGNSAGLVSLRFLLGLLALVFCIVGLSGCGGGWGEFKPTITANVQDVTVKAGATANFSVAATGTGPITYQWYKNGSAMQGATGQTFSMVAQASDTGAKITAGATNAGGTATSTGILPVQTPPAITTQPASQIAKVGDTTTFNVVATGTAPLTYQWFQNGAPIGGAVSSSYTTPAATATGSSTFTVTVSNLVGNVTSVPAVLTVNPQVQTPTLAFAPIPTHTYGDQAFPVTANSASSGAVTYAVVSGPATISGNMVAVTGVGPVVLSASQVANGNYAAASASTNFTVNPGVPALTFAAIPGHNVGDAPFPVIASSASNGAVTYTVTSGPATITGNMVTLTGAGVVVLGASQAAAGGYGPATASTTFTVGPQTPTLLFAPIGTQSLGGAPFAVHATSASTGAVTYTVVSGPATIAGNVVTLTGNSPVVLAANQAAAGNYAAATAQTTVDPNTQLPVLVFAPIGTHTFGDAPFTISANSASSGAVTYVVASGPATIAGNTVTLTGIGPVTLTANQAASGSFLAPLPATATFTVNAATPLLAFAPVASHSFGGAPFTVSATSASNGVVTYSVISGPATVTGNTVTLTGDGPVVLGATQAASGNYVSASAQTTLQAGAATPTLVFAPVPGHTFGDLPFPVSATSASPAAVTYAVANGPATIAGNTVTVTGIGTVTLTANQAATAGYSAATAATVSFIVAAATPTLTIAPIAPQTYGNPPFAVVATSASAGAVTYTVVSGPATIAGNMVTATGNGTVTLSATQAANGNYTSATANATVLVGVQVPALAFAPVGTHNYGDAPFTVSATSASSGAVTYSVISGPATVAGNVVTVTGAGTVILGASQAAAAPYATANTTTTLTVGAETPTLAFSPIATQTFGGAPFTVSATSASNGAVTYAVVSGPATVSGNTVVTTGVGNVLLSASQAAIGSYGPAVASTNFSVVATTPTLTFAPIGSHTYGDAPFMVSATSASNGAVSYSVVSGPATVSGNTVTITGNGTVVLGASQVASGNYTAATAQTSVTVGTATPTLTFAPVASHTYGDPAFTVSATSASSGAVTYAVASGNATISGNTVTLTGAGSVTLTANQAASGNYAAPAQATVTFSVATAVPVLTFAPIPSQTYGGAPFKVSATSASDGAVTYSVVSGPATIAGNIVTVTGDGTITLGANQLPSGNYSAASTTTFVNVGVATPTLTFAPVAAQTFGATPFTVSASSASSGVITYSVVSGPATISGSTVTSTGAGTVVIGASQAAAPGYGGATASISVNVGPAAPTLAFAPLGAHAFGDAPFTVNASSASTGTVTYTVASGNATVSGNTVTITGTGPIVLNASQAATTNYAAATASATLSVSAAKPTLTFAAIGTHTYGDAPFPISASSASNGAITYSVTSGPATISGNTVTITGAGSVVLGASQSATDNYAAATASTNFAVGDATPTLTFAPIASHTFGDAPFTVTATSASTGAVTYAVQSGPATIYGNTVTLTGAGTVVLTANQAAYGNYNAAAQVTASFTDGNATPTLTFNAIGDKIFGNAPFTVSATSASSGPVVYTVQSGPATIAGNTVTLTGAGTVVLTANQAANGNYNAAAQVTTSFAVGNATPTLTFTPVSNHTFGDAPFTVNASSASAGPVIYTVQTGPATVFGNTVTITGVGTVVLAANQAASGNYNAAAQVTTSFNVALANVSLTFGIIANHTFGDAPFPVSATSSSAGAVVYTVLSGPATISGNTVTLTGSGTVVLAANQAASGNYAAAAQVTASFTVSNATPALTWTPVPNHTYGDPSFTVNATSTSPGLIVYSVKSGPGTISGNTVTVTGTGTVLLAANQAAYGNFNAAPEATTSFTVGVEMPTLTFAAIGSKTYGDAAFTVSATSASSGTVTYAVTSGNATISGNTVTITGTGTVNLSASQAAAGNYAASTATTSFTVAAGTPAVTLSVANQVYGVTPFTVNATSNSTGPITYTVASGPATISGNTITLTGIGTVTLSASQTAAGSYTAGSVQTSFSVAAGTPAITFSVPDQTLGAAPFTVSAGSNSTGAFTYSLVSGPATVTGNTVTLTGKGVVTLKAAQAAAGNYAAGSTTTSFNVNPAVTISSITPANATIAPGTQVFSATVKGGVTNAINWSGSAGTFSGSTWTSPSAAGTYTITATSVENPSVSSTTNITVSAPIITTQPTGLSECPVSGNFTLTVAAQYAATYQWFANGTAISGATASSYTISTSTAVATTNYTVQVSNAAGSVTSTAAAVTLGTVLTSGVSNVSIFVGQTATFSINGTSGSQQVNLQWYRIPAGSSTGVRINGATGNTYTTGQEALSNSGDQYYVAVTDSCGANYTSSKGTLTVSPANQPPSITKQPVGQTASVGGTATFSVTATGAGTLSYQWYQIPAGQTAGVPVAAATSASYTVPSSATAVSDDQDKYYVVVSNAYGQAVSKNATLAVGTGILIQNQPVTVYTSVGSSASYSVTASSPLPLTYQWYQAAPSSSTFSQIAGATASTYNIPAASAAQNGSVFYVVVSNAATSAQSTTAALFVGPLNSIPVCSNGWNTVGTAQAVPSGCGYQLTAPQQQQHGDIVWPSLLPTDNVQLSFTVTTSNASSTPADGYAVVFGDPSLGATLTSVGSTGQGLGAEGIPGLVVAFDDYSNPGDPSVPYIGVGRGETTLWENPYFYSNTTIPALAVYGETISHAYNITLLNGFMTVTMDNTQVFSGQVNVPPVSYLYVTSSTGSLWEQTVVTNISLTTAP